MNEWKLGSKKRPIGNAVIYCKQPNGTYTAAFCDAVKREGFYESQIPQENLESIIKTAKERELDIIFIGEKNAKENYVELVLLEIGEYQILYNNQPKKMKEASLRLPAINQ